MASFLGRSATAVKLSSPVILQARQYPALASYKIRIGVVSNVKKITNSMKMVAASKMKIAQARLAPALTFSEGANKVLKDLKFGTPEESTLPQKDLVLVVNTDRGMCGAVTANAVRAAVDTAKSLTNVEFASVGAKGQDALVGFKKTAQIGLIALDLGQKPVTFLEVAYLADQLLARNPSSITIVYTKFFNMLKNEIQVTKIPVPAMLRTATQWEETEFDDEDPFENLSEFLLASTLWRAIHDNQAVEHAVRYTSMDGASTNAGELVNQLTLVYNKARQASITTELSEIVGGMTAIMQG